MINQEMLSHEVLSVQNLIPVKDVSQLTLANELVDKYMSDWDYEIPEINNPNVKYLIGISGGVDSSALAVALLTKHPELRERCTLLFSDTGNEPDGCYQILDRLEKMFEIPVVRLKGKTLFGVIDTNGGYLPSARARWCTKILKLDSWNKYLKNELLTDEKSKVISFSGIRYDEQDRTGVKGVDCVEAAAPFVDQKVERAAVCSLATSLDLMNSAYMQGRSRSGCQNCFFSSKQELISLLIWDPKAFAEGEKREKIAANILDRLTQDKKSMHLKASGFYTIYPMSNLVIDGKDSFSENTFFGVERQDVEGVVTWDYRKSILKSKAKRVKKQQSENQQSLFLDDDNEDNEVTLKSENADSVITEEECTLYVAIENYKHSMMAMFDSSDQYGVWTQRLVTYSRTLGGLSRSLTGYHKHRQMAARCQFLDEDDYNDQSHITVLQIHFNKGIIPKISYAGDSYTWTCNRSYAEVAYIVRCIERVAELHVSKELVTKRRQHILTENAESFIRAWKLDGSPDLGKITGIGHYRPVPLEVKKFAS